MKDLQKKGIELTDETKAYFGEVLEAARELYTITPEVSKPVKKELPKKK